MQRYDIMHEIGHGAYSTVYKALDTLTNNFVAIKKINHTNPDIHVVLDREIRTLQTLRHANIIKLLATFGDQLHTYLVLEHLPCDLITYYKELKTKHGRNLNDEQICHIFYQIAQALHYMHQKGLMHRDIKPENVLIDPRTLGVKLIDFGFAVPVSPYCQHTHYMVTRWYRPLEIVLNLHYDTKVDVFALGALILELYRGEEIFKSASNIDQLYWLLEVCGYPTGWSEAIARMKQLGVVADAHKQGRIYTMTGRLRKEAESIIVGMLQNNPTFRFTMGEIVNHGYFGKLREKMARELTVNQTVGESYDLGNRSPSRKYINDRPSLATDSGRAQFRAINSNPSALYGGYQMQPPNNTQMPKYYGVSTSTPNSHMKYDLKLNLNNLDNRKPANGPISTDRSNSSGPPIFVNQHQSMSSRVTGNRRELPTLFNDARPAEKIRTENSYSKDKEINFVGSGKQQPYISTPTSKKFLHTYSSTQLYKKYDLSNGKNKLQAVSPGKPQQKAPEVMKYLKQRTRSYQGIQVISLNRNSSNFNEGSAHNPERILSFNVDRKKEPAFTRIRGKFAHEGRPDMRVKISLTDRNTDKLEKRMLGRPIE